MIAAPRRPTETMGELDITAETSAAALRRFMQRVLADLRALERMLDSGLIESGVHRIGAEQPRGRQPLRLGGGQFSVAVGVELIEQRGQVPPVGRVVVPAPRPAVVRDDQPDPHRPLAAADDQVRQRLRRLTGSRGEGQRDGCQTEDSHRRFTS